MCKQGHNAKGKGIITQFSRFIASLVTDWKFILSCFQTYLWKKAKNTTQGRRLSVSSVREPQLTIKQSHLWNTRGSPSLQNIFIFILKASTRRQPPILLNAILNISAALHDHKTYTDSALLFGGFLLFQAPLKCSECFYFQYKWAQGGRVNPRPRQDGTMLNTTHSTLLMARNNIDFIHVSWWLYDV